MIQVVPVHCVTNENLKKTKHARVIISACELDAACHPELTDLV